MSNRQVKHFFKKRPGMSLVMSLIILSIMLTSVLALGKFVINELKMSTNATNSIAAYYAADSGLEKALYYLKYGMAERNLSVFSNLERNSPFAITGYDASYTFNRATTTSLAPAVGSHAFTIYNISTSSPGSMPGTLSILDPAGNVQSIDWGPGSGNPTYSYQVFWKVKNCFPTRASQRLEVTNISFASNFTNIKNESHILICDCSFLSGDWCDDGIGQFNMTDDRYYRFAFRPLDGKVAELSFDVLEHTPPNTVEAIGIKSQAFVEVEGYYHNSGYRLQAHLPTLSVVNNVFSYVIFSEQPLIKGL